MKMNNNLPVTATTPTPPDLRDMLDDVEKLLSRSFLDQSGYASQRVPAQEADLLDLRLGLFKRVRFRKPSDIRQGLMAFLDTINLFKLPFIYAVNAVGGEYQVLFGLWSEGDSEQSQYAFDTIFDSVKGFFPGCEVKKILSGDGNNFEKPHNDMNSTLTKETWWGMLQTLTHRRAVTGLPSDKLPTEAKNKQEQTEFGLEELTDAAPDNFALFVYAKPVQANEKEYLLNQVSQVHDRLHPYVKISAQQSESDNISHTDNWNESTSDQVGSSKGESTNTTKSQQPDLVKRSTQNLAAFFKGGSKAQTQESVNKNTQENRSHSETKGSGGSDTYGATSSRSTTAERTNKKAAYIEEHLNRWHKRLSTGSGLWQCFTEIFADSPTGADKIAQLVCGIFSGEESRLDPMRYVEVPATLNHLNFKEIETFPNHPMGSAFSDLSTILTTAELARITRLPLHEIPGIEVEKLTEYGRNWVNTPHNSEDCTINLGHLVDREHETTRSVAVTPNQLQRHAFVSGATGSGKSNTMRHLVSRLWEDCKIPFLVIEPIKREYRELQSSLGGEMQVFALGDRASDFSLNPFDFDPAIGLVPHIDLLKAAFNASLGMYSSMPFILEHIIYQAYEKCGWNLETGQNSQLERMAARLGLSPDDSIQSLFLPVMSDLPPMVDEAITNFFPSATDYSGSLTGALKARLGSLTKGAKGALLNRRQSMPLAQLLEKPAVLELWPFTDNEEKSFVMALILMRLYEHRQGLELKEGTRDNNPLKHLLVIEEAHRLLAKPTSGGDHSAQGKQKGVEVFADILAEIRSYGQGIVIVDQIPSKLIPDVLRNTDLKIAHRLVDKEDRQILGATMNLDEDQMKDLARLSPGRAAIYYSGLRQALHIKVTDSPLPSLEERQKPLAAPKALAWREAELFGPLPNKSGEPLPEAGLCARAAISLLIYALTGRPRHFEESLDNALEHLPKLLGVSDAALAQAGIISSLPHIGDLMQKRYGDLPRHSAVAVICDAAILLKSWFQRMNLDGILANLRRIDLKLRLNQLAEGPHQPDLTDILMDIHLSEPRLRANFQNSVRAGLQRLQRTGAASALLETLAVQAQGMALGLPLDERALRELIRRVFFRYHCNDETEAAQLGNAYRLLNNTGLI